MILLIIFTFESEQRQQRSFDIYVMEKISEKKTLKKDDGNPLQFISVFATW